MVENFLFPRLVKLEFLDTPLRTYSLPILIKNLEFFLCSQILYKILDEKNANHLQMSK